MDYLHERMHETGLRTIKGTIKSFAIGKTKKNVAVGIIKKAISYGCESSSNKIRNWI